MGESSRSMLLMEKDLDGGVNVTCFLGSKELSLSWDWALKLVGKVEMDSEAA